VSRVGKGEDCMHALQGRGEGGFVVVVDLDPLCVGDGVLGVEVLPREKGDLVLSCGDEDV